MVSHKAAAAATRTVTTHTTTTTTTATAASTSTAGAAANLTAASGRAALLQQQSCPSVGDPTQQPQQRAAGLDEPHVRGRLATVDSEPYCEQAALVEAGSAAGSDGGAPTDLAQPAAIPPGHMTAWLRQESVPVPTAGGAAAMDGLSSTGAHQTSTRTVHNRACTDSISGVNNKSSSDVNKIASSSNRLLSKLWDLPRSTETEAATVGLVLAPCYGDDRCACNSHKQRRQLSAAPAAAQQLAEAASATLLSSDKGEEKKRFSLRRLRHLALGLVGKVRLSAAGSEVTGSGNSKCSSGAGGGGAASWSAGVSGVREPVPCSSMPVAAVGHAGTAQTAASSLSSSFHTNHTRNTHADNHSLSTLCSAPPGLYDRTRGTAGSHAGRTLLQAHPAPHQRALQHVRTAPAAAAAATAAPRTADDTDPWAGALATSTLALNLTQTGLHPTYLTSLYRPSGDGSEACSPFTAAAYMHGMDSLRTQQRQQRPPPQQQQQRQRPSAPVVPLRTASYGADHYHCQPLSALRSIRSAVSVTAPAASASAVWAFPRAPPSPLLRAHSEQPRGWVPPGLESFYVQEQQQEQQQPPGRDSSPRFSVPGFPYASPSSWHAEGLHAQQGLFIGVPVDGLAAPASAGPGGGGGGGAVPSQLPPQRSSARYAGGPWCSVAALQAHAQPGGAVGLMGSPAFAAAAGTDRGAGGGVCGGGARPRWQGDACSPLGDPASPAAALKDNGDRGGGVGTQPQWHQVWAVRTTDPVTGEAALVLAQVGRGLRRERHLQDSGL